MRNLYKRITVFQLWLLSIGSFWLSTLLISYVDYARGGEDTLMQAILRDLKDRDQLPMIRCNLQHEANCLTGPQITFEA
jgi:hypothetical protein